MPVVVLFFSASSMAVRNGSRPSCADRALERATNRQPAMAVKRVRDGMIHLIGFDQWRKIVILLRILSRNSGQRIPRRVVLRGQRQSGMVFTCGILRIPLFLK